mmetsp:Transcript_3405/g.5779  ORF Transcript_3405/g.5779 Transcript_3405/m.5779 type:complete len:443 (-) Transcript_3405:1080-2408(-)
MVKIGIIDEMGPNPILDSSWMVHRLQNEDSRNLRCDVFGELVQWDVDTDEEALGFIIGLHDMWTRVVAKEQEINPWWTADNVITVRESPELQGRRRLNEAQIDAGNDETGKGVDDPDDKSANQGGEEEGDEGAMERGGEGGDGQPDNSPQNVNEAAEEVANQEEDDPNENDGNKDAMVKVGENAQMEAEKLDEAQEKEDGDQGEADAGKENDVKGDETDGAEKDKSEGGEVATVLQQDRDNVEDERGDDAKGAQHIDENDRRGDENEVEKNAIGSKEETDGGNGEGTTGVGAENKMDVIMVERKRVKKRPEISKESAVTATKPEQEQDPQKGETDEDIQSKEVARGAFISAVGDHPEAIAGAGNEIPKQAAGLEEDSQVDDETNEEEGQQSSKKQSKPERDVSSYDTWMGVLSSPSAHFFVRIVPSSAVGVLYLNDYAFVTQ